MRNNEYEKELDFSNYKTKPKEEKQKKTINFQAMKKLAIGALIVAGLTGGYYINDSIKDSKVSEAVVLVQQTGQSTVDSLAQFKDKNKVIYLKNRDLLAQLEKDKNLMEAFHIDTNLSSVLKKNESLYQKSEAKYVEDLNTAQHVILASKSSDKNTLRDTFIHNDNDFVNFKNTISNQAVNQQELLNIQNQLTKDVTFIKDAKAEIINTIKEKLKDGNFDISKAKSSFENKLKKDIEEEKKLISDVKKNIAEDSDLKDVVSEKDLNDSEKAIGELSDIAISQIIKDEKTVNEMLQTIEKEGIKVSENNEPAPTQTNTASNSSGFNFMHYYMLYSWINHSTSATSSLAASAAPSYNGSMMNNLRTQSHNMYDFKDSNSHLSRSLVGTGVQSKLQTNYQNTFKMIQKTSYQIHSYQSRSVSRGMSSSGRSFGG